MYAMHVHVCVYMYIHYTCTVQVVDRLLVHVVAVHSQDSIYAATILLDVPKQKTCVNMYMYRLYPG